HSPATPVVPTLSLHDALPISRPACGASVAYEREPPERVRHVEARLPRRRPRDRHVALPGLRRAVRTLDAEHVEAPHVAWPRRQRDRKSTRLNSSHVKISYAVF